MGRRYEETERLTPLPIEEAEVNRVDNCICLRAEAASIEGPSWQWEVVLGALKGEVDDAPVFRRLAVVEDDEEPLLYSPRNSTGAGQFIAVTDKEYAVEMIERLLDEIKRGLLGDDVTKDRSLDRIGTDDLREVHEKWDSYASDSGVVYFDVPPPTRIIAATKQDVEESLSRRE